MLAVDTSSAAIVAAFDAVPHAVFVVGALRPRQPNAYVNAAYSALTGYPAAQAVAPGFDALAIFTDGARIAALDGAGELPADTRVAVRHSDGTTFEAHLGLRAVPLADGGRYIVGTLAPVAAVDSATAGKKAFLSWLNHELRSPLNACSMWLDVVALAPQPDKLTKAVDAIKRNLARQTRLVNELNDAANVSAEGLELTMTPVDLVALVKRGLDAWQLSALAKPLTLEQRIEITTAGMFGDAERLSQALNHVLENAIGSTPSGGRVDLRVHEAGGRCIVEVEDTGVALSEDDAANLGMALWRAPNGAKSRPGLGLGLAVAHHIVTKHGGSLIASRGKVGTRFVLTLPLAAAAPAR